MIHHAIDTRHPSLSDLTLRVLGPVRVSHAGSLVSAGGPKQQALLGLLTLHPGRCVSVDAIVDGVWRGAPPRSVEASVHSYVSNLRSKMGLTIERVGRSYRLEIDPVSVDAYQFEQLTHDGTAHIAASPEQAGSMLRRALSLWTGRAYADLDDVSELDTERRRLDGLRLAATESMVIAELACGRHRELLGDLESISLQHPFHEGFAALHMLALYRDGQAAGALAAYRRIRSNLADELGVEPSHELQALEQAVLEHQSWLKGLAGVHDGAPQLRSVPKADGNGAWSGDRRAICTFGRCVVPFARR